MTDLLPNATLSASINYGFLKIGSCFAKGFEITMVLSLFQNFLEFLRSKENTLILRILKVSESSSGRIFAK